MSATSRRDTALERAWDRCLLRICCKNAQNPTCKSAAWTGKSSGASALFRILTISPSANCHCDRRPDHNCFPSKSASGALAALPVEVSLGASVFALELGIYRLLGSQLHDGIKYFGRRGQTF